MDVTNGNLLTSSCAGEKNNNVKEKSQAEVVSINQVDIYAC